MATGHVTSNATRQFGGTTNSVTVSVSAGDLIACAVMWASSTITLTGISDGDAYTLTGNPTTDTSNSFRGAGGRKENSTSGSKTVVATFSADPGLSILVVHVISGAAASSALDDGLVSYIGATGAGTDADSIALTLGQTGDYIFGVDFDTTQNGAVSAGTGYTSAQTFAGNNGVSEYIENFGSSGSKNVTASPSAFDHHIMVGLAFKAAAGGGITGTVAVTEEADTEAAAAQLNPSVKVGKIAGIYQPSMAGFAS